MATLGATFLSLVDRIKREDPGNERIATIIELLSQTNEIMEDSTVLEGNLPTGHRTTVRTGLPSGTWRKLYEGVPVEKSTTQQVDDSTGMLEAYSEVDKALADLNGNTAAFRLSEAMAFLEGLSQTFATAFIYGDTDVDPEQFMGLEPRFNTLSTDPTDSGFNIIDGGGVGTDNTSVWFVTWGENVCHFIFPKGSVVGLSHDDKGQVTLLDSNSNPFEGYRDHFKWDIGLSVRDWRGIARVANLDVSDLGTATVNLEDDMIDAFYRIRKRPGTKSIYCNEEVYRSLHKRAKDQANVNLTLDTFAGKPVVSFLGIPIREVEAILNTETQVT